jgi:3-hydroxybutyryl-CoA dehydrogenase
MQSLEQVQAVAVLGAGTMGHGIAQIAAQAGLEVQLYDLTQAAADKGLARIGQNLEVGVQKGKLTAAQRDAALGRVRAIDSLAKIAGVQWVIEAVPEDLALKQKLLGALAQRLGPETLLASNTSSLSLSRIAAGVDHPERVLGMHFFNPPHLMKLLELVRGENTSDAAMQLGRALGQKLGKECIEVSDSPGFASSRLGICLAMEAIRMVEAKVASPADIDKAMELGYNHPMGPLRLTDLVGLDVRLTIAEYLRTALNLPGFEPPALLRRLVAEGKLGKKSGEGFYRYPDAAK